MSPIETLFGHPGQMQPSHIVITSPHFDTREILLGGQGRKVHRYTIADMPIDKIRGMLRAGTSYRKISIELEIPESTLKGWIKRTGLQ